MTRSKKTKSNKKRPSAAFDGESERPAPAAAPLNWRKGVGQFVSAAFRASDIALRHRLGLNTETNFIDSISGAATTTSLALLDAGAPIPVGATLGTGQRIGREVRVVRWLTKGYANSPTTTTLAGLVRVIAVFNRQQDGTAFTNANILTNVGSINSLTAGDLAERGGTVVFDRTMPLIGQNNQLLAPAAPIYVPFDFEFTVPDWHLSWPSADTTGLQTANLGGALQVWIMSVGFATALPAVNTTSRIEYVDN